MQPTGSMYLVIGIAVSGTTTRKQVRGLLYWKTRVRNLPLFLVTLILR